MRRAGRGESRCQGRARLLKESIVGGRFQTRSEHLVTSRPELMSTDFLKASGLYWWAVKRGGRPNPRYCASRRGDSGVREKQAV